MAEFVEERIGPKRSSPRCNTQGSSARDTQMTLQNPPNNVRLTANN